MIEIVERGVLDRIDNRYWVSGWRERLILWIARRYVASLGITLTRITKPHTDCTQEPKT